MPIDPATPRDLPAEQLLAVMGIEPILEPGAKIRVTQEKRHRADRVPASIAAEVRRFLAASEPEKERTLPEFKYRQALEWITGLDPEARITALAAAVPDGDDAAGVIVAGGRALQWLKAILPVRSRVTVTGPETIQPNDLVLYRFRRAYAAIQDPMEVLRDLREGTLARDQVKTLQAVYPALYDLAEQALVVGLSELKGSRPSVQFPRWKVRMVENLLLTRSWTPELAKVMQEAFGKQEKPESRQPSPTGLTDKTSTASETPIQRIANK